MIDRRTFLAGTGAVLLAAPRHAEGQKPEKPAHVGILGIGPTPSPVELAKSVSTNPFWLSMRDLGWVDGQNMVVVRRFGESTDQLRKGAAELARLKVDVLFVSSAGLAKILQLETRPSPSWSVVPTMILLPQDSSTASQSLGDITDHSS